MWDAKESADKHKVFPSLLELALVVNCDASPSRVSQVSQESSYFQLMKAHLILHMEEHKTILM